jgi:carboxypeptidase family protein
VRISGRIEVPGRAAPGVLTSARIELLSVLEDDAAARRELAGEAPAPPLAMVHPNGEGAFTLDAPAAAGYRVRVRAEGYLPIEHLVLPLLEDRELPAARLTPASPLTVRAMGPRGEPLPGIRLAVERSETLRFDLERPGWKPAERSGRTDPDGRWVLLRAAGETLALTALDPRFLDARVAIAASGTDVPTLRLAPHPALALAVHAPDGHPVAGALLRLGTRPIGLSGSDGRLEVSFEKPLFAALLLQQLRWSGPGGDLEGGGSAEEVQGGVLPVPLAPRRELAGQLADAAAAGGIAGAAGGSAIAGGLVWVERLEPDGQVIAGVVASATTGPDGRFRLRLSTGPRLQLRAAAPGYLMARVTVPRGKAPWRIALERAADLTGLVVDRSGRPCGNVRVTAQEAGRKAAREREAPAPATTGPDGRFRLLRVAAGAQYQLAVSAPGFAPASALVSVPTARRPAPPVRIVLEAGASLVGTVVDPDGRPLPGVSVTLLRGARLPLHFWRRLAPDDESWEARSDAKGAFAFHHLRPDRYHLMAHGPGLVSAERSDIDVPPSGPSVDAGRLVVEPGVALAGKVTDRRGAPVAHAWVRLSPSPKGQPINDPQHLDAEIEGVATEPDGSFRIPELRRGETFDLEVHHPEHPPLSTREIRVPAAEPLALELADGGRLAGRVVDGAGRPIFGARVRLDKALQEMSHLLDAVGPGSATDAEGRFALAGLAPGTVDIEVRAEGYQPARRRGIPIAEGREAAPLAIVLERGSSLAGQVTDGAGRPVAGATLFLQPPINLPAVLARTQSLSSLVPATTQTDEEGRYRLLGLEPGHYELSLPERHVPPTAIDLQPGANELDVVVREEGKELAISGRLLDAAGAPLASATLTLESASHPSQLAASLTDGSFLFRPVEPGAYQLVADARAYIPSAQPVVVGDAPVEGLELRLERARGAIRGHLVGLRREELLRVQVTAVSFDPKTSPGAGDSRRTALLDDAGGYRITDLAPGRWSVTAVTESGRQASGQVELDPGAPGVPEAELDLDFAAGAALSGRVAKDGAPVAGARVAVVGLPEGASGVVQMETAADGTFRVPGLAPGTYRLLVAVPLALAFSHQTLEISGDQEVAVDLTTAAIQGRVVSIATGEPVAGATVGLENVDPLLQALLTPLTATTREDGTFEIAPLVAGRYQVKAKKPGLAPGAATVQVAPPAAAWIELQLGPPAGK